MLPSPMRPHRRAVGMLAIGCALLLATCLSRYAAAQPVQEPSPVVPASATLADAPAELTGSVADTGGALVPDAVLQLRNLAAGTQHTGRSTETGGFRFAHLAAGTYVLTVAAPGFQAYTSAPFTLTAGQTRSGFAVALLVPADHADVTVSVSRHELAAEQLHAAEQQRVLGVFPNFYTSFEAHPAPLTAVQKLSLAFHATLDPVAFATAGLVASGEQIRDTFPAYGHGSVGYARRYGAAFADGFSGKMIGAGILPGVFRQDPRYFYLGTGSAKRRAWHAISSAFLARSDGTGRWEPNYSHILGNAAAGALSTTYHPAADSAGTLALDNALLGTLGEAGVNLTREFLLRHFTRNVPPAATVAP